MKKSMNAEYQAAYDKNTLAIKAYHKAVAAYRSMQIGDAEFIAAQKVYKLAMDEFDVAYAAAEEDC